jgi:hypothetical protein
MPESIAQGVNEIFSLPQDLDGLVARSAEQIIPGKGPG